MCADRQLIAIGLEAAEPRVVQDMLASGRLPNFESMTRNGIAGTLRSCTEVSSGSTWPSINTGVGPRKHRLGFYHRQFKSGTYDVVKRYAHETAVEPFWHHLARIGYKMIIADVPDTYVDPNFEETIVVGWGAEALNASAGSNPAELLPEIERHFGEHPLKGWYQNKPDTHEGWLNLARLLADATRLRTDVYLWLLEQKRLDLFFGGFPEPHWAGHFFWFLRDPDHPDYDPELAAICGDAIANVYDAIDEGIGRLLAAHPAADLMIFSNSGMGPNYSGLHLIQEILDRTGIGVQRGAQRLRPLDFLKPQKLWGPAAVRKIESIIGVRTLTVAKKFVPEKIWDVATRRFLQWGHGWESSKAFTIPNDQSTAIRVNLKGREPHGLVEDGDEYYELFEEIKALLMDTVNPATGERPIKEVFLLNDRYPGDKADDFADIVVNWKHDAYVAALESPRFGLVQGELPDMRSGAHNDDAFFLASGPHVNSTQFTRDCRIEDIAPTIYHYFDEDIPRHLEGTAILEVTR